MKQPPGRYIDPLTDWGVKRLFGSEPNKDILKDCLNELFRGEKSIADITYSPNEHGGDHRESKKAIFDLYCTGDKGERFIVEMQRGRSWVISFWIYLILRKQRKIWSGSLPFL